MRPVVALLSARPETIADDYARLWGLAGLDSLGCQGDLIVAAEAGSASWVPGRVCPPWQLEAALRSLAANKTDSGPEPMMVSVTDSGPSPFSGQRDKGWNGVLEGFSANPMNTDQLAEAPFRPVSLLPALESVLPRGFRISPHFRGKNLLVLSCMGIEKGGVLKGNLALLASLLAPKRKVEQKIPYAEIMSEIMGLAREVFPTMGVLTDATVLSVVRRGGVPVPLVRNLLIAGTDCVAVDSVLARLAGLNPLDSPWLRLCQDRGLGVMDPSGIKIVGEPEWLDLDFQIPGDTFASGPMLSRWLPSGLLKFLPSLNRGSGSTPLDTAWDRLFRDYQSGATL